MKESFYFQHDYFAREDDKILELRSKYGNEGYAVYWYCIEVMAERGDGYIMPQLLAGLSLSFGVKQEWLVEFCEFCTRIKLFQRKNKKFTTERIQNHLAFRRERTNAGKLGAKTRWEHSSANGSATSSPNSSPMAQPMHIKEKKIKENKKNYFVVTKKNPAIGDGQENFIEFWEKNFGMLTQHICEELKDLDEQHGEENLVKAMKVASQANVRNVRYVKAVLDREKSIGYLWEQKTANGKKLII